MIVESAKNKLIVGCFNSRFTVCFFCAGPSPPVVVQVKRISPSQIRVSWEPSPHDSTGGPVIDYTVKYYPLSRDTFVQRSVEDLFQFVTSNKTEVVIQDLDPGLSYSVSVAANNAAGRGSYSDDVTVGCKWPHHLSSIYISLY